MASNEQAANNHHNEHHVHFDDNVRNDDFVEDNSIQYHVMGCKGIAVHLGFLQVNHRYDVELSLPLALVQGNHLDLKNLNLVQEKAAVPNINCRLLQVSGIKDDHLNLKLNFFAYKEKLLKENFTLVNEGRSAEQLRLVITARVLGRGKGTPMLRNGIHCVGIEVDDESDASDWVGFSRTDTDDDL